MATQKVVVEGSSGVTASQLKDLFRQIEDGSIDGAYMQSVLDHCTPTKHPAAPVVTPKLLESVAAIATPAVDKFVAAEHFKVDTGKKAAVKIAFLWGNFAENFVPKVEEGVPSGDLKVQKLLRSSLDAPIIAELGEKHETMLADLWAMLKAQPGGEKGTLLTNGYANIFYIRDAKGILWAVSARWSSGDGGWFVSADSVEDPRRWGDGYQVVSR